MAFCISSVTMCKGSFLLPSGVCTATSLRVRGVGGGMQCQGAQGSVAGSPGLEAGLLMASVTRFVNPTTL